MTVDPLLTARLRKLGMVHPLWTASEAHSAGLNLPLACSILTQESGGGRNEFGHDPTIFIGAGEVTRVKYEAYKAARVASGNRLMQGVGPCQLTYWTLQDAADRLGGCWDWRCNVKVGFALLVENIRRDGLLAGVRAYNGSGLAAAKYAEAVLGRASEYAAELHLPAPK